MGIYLGIDTSNYTTSAALSLEGGRVAQVREGAVGLRQSDALFHHVRQLPEILTRLFQENRVRPDAVGVSTRPRSVEGSYMPCFTAGECVARSLAAVWNIPLVKTSHQCGHLMAALYSCGRLDLAGQPFLAFHVSGGTTEALLVEPGEETAFSVRLLARSLDLKAGQDGKLS